jgi:acyl carrier protein
MEPDDRSTAERLRSYILAEFLPGEDPANLGDETPLLSTGILDSIGLLQLVGFVEITFAVELEAHDTSFENFDRIADITALIRKKLEMKAS